MQNLNDIDEELMSLKIKNKFGKDVEIFFPNDQRIHYVKILKQRKYFVINSKYDFVLSTGYDEILFANEVATNTFYSDEAKLNDDIFSNQLSAVHIDFNNHLIIVKSNSKYGMFNSDGQEVLPIQYQRIIWVSKDRIIICKEGKYGLSDTKGTCLMPCIYDKIYPIPFVIQYGYGYDDKYKKYTEDIKLLAAQSSKGDNYVEIGFNLNGEMIIHPCIGINSGEYLTLVETFSEFPYICAELYRNLILELFPRRYYFLDLKTIGFDYNQYIEEYEECADYVCGKIVEDSK